MNHKRRGVTDANRPEKWTAGIDWFRYKTREFADYRPVLAAIRDIQSKDLEKASNLRPWRFQGWAGQQTDTIRWGVSGGSLIWESSGTVAHSTLGLSDLCDGYASRIDLQITLSLCSPLLTFGTSLLKSIIPNSNSQPQTRIPAGLHLGTSGLWLGTVGKRTHHSYLRVYDKGVESRSAPPGKMWRVELETKYSHSRTLWQLNRRAMERPEWCAQYVVQSSTSRGFSWPFALHTDESLDVNVGRKTQTTPSRLAAWLCRSVSPVIPRLLTVFTVGEVLQMLGLSDVAVPTGKDDAHG